MTAYFTRQIVAFRNSTVLSKILRVCAWICWVVGAFYFAVPYFYAFSGTRIGPMAIVFSSFVGIFFGVIGFPFYLLSHYAGKETLGPLAKVVLWSIAGAACFGIYVLVMLATWSVIEHLIYWARSG